MTEEISIAGVFLPTFVAACIFALGLGAILSAAIKRIASPRINAIAWHPLLFEFAILVILVDISYALLGTLLP